MRKIAKIVQSGRNNPTFYLDRDIRTSAMEAVSEWDDTPDYAIGHTPEVEVYEVWIVRAEDAEWSDVELLPAGEYHEPPMAKRDVEESDGEYIYQPLLVGKRMQIHKEGAMVKAFDHKGREMSGRINVGESEVDLSPAFLSIISTEEPNVAIFDAVLSVESNELVVTDVLLFNEMDARSMSAIGRMSLLDSIQWDGDSVRSVEWSENESKNTIARPTHEGYFSEWVVIPEEE